MPKGRGRRVGPAEARADDQLGTQVGQLLMALLMLAVDEREGRSQDRPKQIKSEVLLARSGLSSGVIATLVNKQPGAVRTTLSRAKGNKAT